MTWRVYGIAVLLVVSGWSVLPVRVELVAEDSASEWNILFESERDGRREVYVMKASGSHQRRLTHTPGNGEGSWSARWSPDRTKIAFTSTREGNVDQVYVMDADGSNVRRLSYREGLMSANPAWSPDGKSIAFESCSADACDIFLMDSDGSNVRQLTNAARMGNCENPDWSPDGTTIAFELGPRESDRDGNYEIYLMNVDGSQVRQLTYMAGRGKRSAKWPKGVHAWRPRWSADRTRILFSAGRARSEEVYTLKPDGSDLRQLTRSLGEQLGSRHPVWSPDGKCA